MPRVFFAVWPTPVAAKALHDAARQTQKDCGGRLMRRETLHLTLAFLGDVSDERLAEVRRVADGVVGEAFDVALDRIGYWKHNRILWAGGESPRLTLLAKHLNDGLRAAGFRLDGRPFVAHMTLLRDARCAALPLAPVPPLPVVWTASEFVLVESKLSSEGSSYEVVGRWPLAASAASG